MSELNYYHSSLKYEKLVKSAKKQGFVSGVLRKENKNIILVNLPTSNGDRVQVIINEDTKENKGNKYYITDPYFENIINHSLKTM